MQTLTFASDQRRKRAPLREGTSSWNGQCPALKGPRTRQPASAVQVATVEISSYGKELDPEDIWARAAQPDKKTRASGRLTSTRAKLWKIVPAEGCGGGENGVSADFFQHICLAHAEQKEPTPPEGVPHAQK